MKLPRKIIAFFTLLLFSLLVSAILTATVETTSPSESYVTDLRYYSASYSTTLENGTIIKLTPTEHNASCTLIQADYPEYRGWSESQMLFNSTSLTYYIQFPATEVGNFSNTFFCNASGYPLLDPITSIEQVLPAPTAVSPAKSVVGQTVSLKTKYYPNSTGVLIHEKDNAICNFSIQEESISGNLPYNETSGIFENTIQMNNSGTFNWTVWCTAYPNFEPASAQSTFFIENQTLCETVEVNGNVTLYEGKMCSNENGASLYTISTDNSILDCNGMKLEGIGEGSEQAPIAIENAYNVSIRNCNIENFMTSVMVVNSTNVVIQNISTSNLAIGIILVEVNNSRVENFNFTASNALDTLAALFPVIESFNNTFSNGAISNYSIGIAVSSNGTTFRNITVNGGNYGLIDFGTDTVVQNVTFDGAQNALALLASNRPLIENVTVLNAAFDSEIPAVAVMTNESILRNLVIVNSSHDAFRLTGSNNRIQVNISDTNGTAFTLANDVEFTNSSANNSISLYTANNTLDLNITGNGSIFNNSFTVNNALQSFFFNVTNAEQLIIAQFAINFTANNSIIAYSNLTLYNDTGIVNVTNLQNLFKFTSNSVYLNSSAVPFFSQFATVTLTGASYANNSMYNVFKDGSICSNCIKLSSNPAAVFQVFGFSNYSTSAVETTTTPTPVTPTPAPQGAPAVTSATPSAVTVQTNNANNAANSNSTNNTSSKNLPKATKNNSSSNTANNSQTQNASENTSLLTGLFAAMPVELNNPIAIATIVLIAIATISLVISKYITRLHSKPPRKNK